MGFAETSDGLITRFVVYRKPGDSLRRVPVFFFFYRKIRNSTAQNHACFYNKILNTFAYSRRALLLYYAASEYKITATLPTQVKEVPVVPTVFSKIVNRTFFFFLNVDRSSFTSRALTSNPSPSRLRAYTVVYVSMI